MRFITQNEIMKVVLFVPEMAPQNQRTGNLSVKYRVSPRKTSTVAIANTISVTRSKTEEFPSPIAKFPQSFPNNLKIPNFISIIQKIAFYCIFINKQFWSLPLEVKIFHIFNQMGEFFLPFLP